jgi:NADH-quinone oxidoreductase subunit H
MICCKAAMKQSVDEMSTFLAVHCCRTVVYLAVYVFKSSGRRDLRSRKHVKSKKAVWFVFPLFPLFLMFFISALAETNRAPFDLPEAEAELVSGYNTEYAAMGFALFFLGEYANMILMCASATILFLGGWLPLFDFAPFTWIPGVIWFGLKVSFLLFEELLAQILFFDSFFI